MVTEVIIPMKRHILKVFTDIQCPGSILVSIYVLQELILVTLPAFCWILRYIISGIHSHIGTDMEKEPDFQVEYVTVLLLVLWILLKRCHCAHREAGFEGSQATYLLFSCY